MAPDDSTPSPADAEEQPGAELGPYTLTEPLGEGGFGTVWVAGQERPVKRRVAIKLLKAGMASGEILARFGAERQALALMDHPGIAGVLDAGTTPSGRPYFVMEYVQGLPLIHYADTHTLDLRARLELFRDVCHAVQHAHHKGVVHRDLKPDNVLVSEDDGRPLPRVIDFGIAKAVVTPLTDSTLQTGAHQIMGTPAYMAPEQATRSADVDTRADVYSLGAMLYELLTGERTFDAASRRTTTLEEMLRHLREVDPARPSERVADLGGERAAAVSAWRGTTHDRLERALRGDLDWIVMRALEKDRGRRYDTAAALADDIQRHLQDEPVLAGPPSATYRLRKLARRNRGVVVGLGVAAAALVATLAVLAWSVMRVGQERDDAERARDEAQRAQALAEERRRSAEDSLDASREVTRFLGDMLSAASPVDLGLDATVLAVLDRAAPSIGERFARRPHVESELHYTVGTTYRSLGRIDPAREHLARAVELLEELWGPDHPDTLVGRKDLALADWYGGHHTRALADIEEVVARLSAQLDGDDPRTVEALNVLGIVKHELGDGAGARAAWETVLEARERLLGDDHPDTLTSRHNLALALGQLGLHDRSLAMLAEVHGALTAVRGSEHPDTLSALNDVGAALEDMGRYDEAMTAFEHTLEVRRRVLGEEHPMTLGTAANLGACAWQAGRTARALELAEDTVVRCRRVLGDDHDITLQATDLMGSTLMALERYDESRPFVEAAYAGRRRVLGEEHPDTLISLQNLGALAFDSGDLPQAERILRQLVASQERAAGGDHPDTLRARYVLCSVLLSLQRLDEAETLLRDVIADSDVVHGRDSLFTLRARSSLAWVLLDLAQNEEAEELFHEVHEGGSRLVGPTDTLPMNALEGLARLYRDTGQDERLVAMARELYALTRQRAEGQDATPWDMAQLAWYLTDGPVPDLYEPALGLRWAEAANEATAWSVPRYLDTLAVARRENGLIEEAVEAHRLALSLMAPDDPMRGYHEEEILILEGGGS